MPKSSQKQHNIKQLENDAIAETILDLLSSDDELEELLDEEESPFNKKCNEFNTFNIFDSDSDSDSDSDDALSFLTYANEERYHIPRKEILKSDDYMTQVLHALPEERFIQKMHLSQGICSYLWIDQRPFNIPKQLRVYANSKLVSYIDSLFDGAEYLLADSGYSVSRTIIPTFKKPNNQSMPRENEEFNTAIGRARIHVEHTIGCLKGWLRSLRGLRILIRKAGDHARAVLWIRACAVLHNLLLEDMYDDRWTENDQKTNGDNREVLTLQVIGQIGRRDGESKREQLKHIILGSIAQSDLMVE